MWMDGHTCVTDSSALGFKIFFLHLCDEEAGIQ